MGNPYPHVLFQLRFLLGNHFEDVNVMGSDVESAIKKFRDSNPSKRCDKEFIQKSIVISCETIANIEVY